MSKIEKTAERADGFVILIEGRYVSAILANGNPETPVVYYTKDIDEAKAWKTPGAVRKARARVAKGGMILVYSLECRKDGPGKQRVPCGMLAKNGTVTI